MIHHQQKLSDKQMAALLALLITIMPFSIDAYLPSLTLIAEDLHSDIHRIEQSLSSFIFGVAFGQLVGGSLSDIKGRKNIALTGLSIYIVSTFLLIFVQSAEQLLSLRLVQAVGAGMAAVVVGAIVRDNYEGKEAAQMFALIGIIMMGAPLLAPMVGSMMQMIGGWRAVFVFLLLYSVMVFALYWKFLPKHKMAEPLPPQLFRNLAQRYGRVLRHKTALGFLFFQATSFSSMLVFLTESPFVYMKLHELSPNQYAWAFGCNIIMMAVFNRTTAWHLKRDRNSQDILRAGIIIQFLANLSLFISVLIWQLPPLWLMIMLIMTSIGTQGLIVANTQALFMSHFREDAGSANAVLASCQSLIAALVGFTTTLLHNGSAMVMAGMMLACTTLGIVLLMIFSHSIMRQKC